MGAIVSRIRTGTPEFCANAQAMQQLVDQLRQTTEAVMRGGSEAVNSNRAIHAALAAGLATSGLPADAELRATRRLVMWAAHLMVLVPLLAVFLARGVGTR